MSETLADALPREMARVRDQVLPAYLDTGRVGAFAVAMMRAELDRAAEALAERDIIAMIDSYLALREWDA